ncbi:hypothetical protein BH11PLA1_BH11PLA1_20220 [soil metagenome]
MSDAESHQHLTRGTLPITRAPLWKRFLLAPESGLVAVILAIVIGLTVYTQVHDGPIPRKVAVAVSAGATVSEVSEAGDFTVTSGGRATAYRGTEGFELRGTPEAPIVWRTVLTNKFLNADNLMSVLTQASYIAVMAVGMTGIIVMGGIDLSVGSIYALAGVFGAMAIQKVAPGAAFGSSASNSPATLLVALPVCLVVCCGVGALCGLVNGVATVGLKVHPFIITLGGMAIYRGIASVSTGGQSVNGASALQGGAMKLELWGVTPIPVFIMIVVGAIGAFVFARMVFGRRVFAIGGNEVAARYAGVPVGRIKIALFVINGMLAGLSALIYLGYLGAADSGAGSGYELSVIAAAVVGGASLSGGRGSAIGAVLGAIVIELINNSILMLNISQAYQQIIIGFAIVLAVVVDQAKQRLVARKG